MKTRINKFMSLLLAMVMLISMITVVNVSAATVGGLTLKTSGTAAVAESTEQVYSGDKSIKFTSVSTSGDDIWYGENAELGVTRGNKYSVEMYIYPITSTGKVTVSLDGGTRVDVTYDGTTLNVSNKTNWSATQADKSGWWKVATNGAIEVASHATNTTWKPQFMIGRGFQFYLDSIKITPENSTTPVFSANFDTPKIDISEMEEGAVTELYNTTSVESKVGYATDETGNRLLKIDAKAGGGVWLGDPVEDFGMQAHSGDSKPGYGIAFDIYIDNWTGGKLWLKPAPNNNNTYSTVYYASLNYSAEKGLYLDDTNKGRWKITALTGEKAGWYRVENTTAICSEKGFASVNGYGRGYMWYVPADNTGDISVCVDNIELYNWTDGYTGQNTGSITGDPIKVIDFETVAIDYDARVDYMPKNFMAVHVAETKMSVSWRNPVSPSIATIKLYDITNPKAATEITPATAFSTTADAINEYVQDGVSAGNTYTYRLEYTFTDGTVKSYITGCTAVGKGYENIAGSWNLGSSVNNTTQKKHTAKMNIDDRIYKTSAPSIHYVSNQTQAVDKGGNSFLKLSLPNGVEYDTTKVYKIKGYYKKNNAGYVFDRILSSTIANDWRMYKICGTWGQFKTEDWTAFEDTRTPDSATGLALNLTFVDSVEDIWFDDIEVYELVGDANSAINEEKGNLLASNGAVNDVSARPADLTTVTATPVAFGTKLSWTAGEGHEYVAVYDKAMSEYNPVAYVPASLGEVTIANLEDGETYDYIVKTVNAEGRESENGTEVQATAGGEELIVTYYVPAKNFIVTQVSGTQISVSWRNPKAVSGMVSTITKAELYDADTNALIYEGTDMTANAISEYLDTDFTAGTPKNYRLDLTYSDGVVKSQVAGIVPASAGYSYGAGSWQVISSASVKPSAEMSVDDDVYRTAAPSIHIVSNNTAGLDKKELRLKLVSNTTLDTTKTYRVEGYAKMNKTGYVFEFMLGNTSRSYMIHDKWTQFLTHENWVKFTKDIVPDNAASPIINFNLADSTEDFWIDDVTLYELTGGEGTETTGDNLLAGIGTCDDVSAAPAELTDVSAKNRTNEAMIKWGDTDAAYVAVYDNNVSEDIPVAYVPASMGYVDLKNLEAGKTYNYTVKAVNAEGRESAAGVAVSATPLAEALVISDYKTSASGNEVSVSVDLKNNSYGNDLTAQLFLAVYDGKALESIAQSDMTGVPQTELGADPVTVSTKINVPQGKTMVMYLWNSLDGMKPLKACEAYVAE